MAMKPGLYVAATPIGNLKDASFRLIDTLKAADAIYCEDTRQTAKLCQAYGVTTPRRAYHDHNAAAVRPAMIADLAAGATYCLVSDAGTPLISDPGFKLVAEARAAGVEVFTIPGPCAAIAGLSVAGLPTDRFLFAGFPPPKEGARRTFFASLAGVEATLVFYEAGSRVAASLGDMAAHFGDRRAVIARELTKLHEEVLSGSLSELSSKADSLKGEIVVIVEGPEAIPAAAGDIEDFLEQALRTMSLKDAASAAADMFSIPKRASYEKALSIKSAKPSGAKLHD
jgi:16S rRNA (cytidine1402-2'-O)-methyltransferase